MTIQEILSGLAATNTNYAVELKEAGFPQPAKLADMIIMGPAKINYREILKEMMRQRSDFTRDKCVDILKKLLNIHSSRQIKSSVNKNVVSRIIKEIDNYCSPRNRYLTNVSVDGYLENKISESEASIHIDEIRGCLYDLKDQLVSLLNEEEWEGLSEDYWDAVNYCRDWLTREACNDLYEDIFAPISREINVEDTERGIMANSRQIRSHIDTVWPTLSKEDLKRSFHDLKDSGIWDIEIECPSLGMRFVFYANDQKKYLWFGNADRMGDEYHHAFYKDGKSHYSVIGDFSSDTETSPMDVIKDEYGSRYWNAITRVTHQYNDVDKSENLYDFIERYINEVHPGHNLDALYFNWNVRDAVLKELSMNLSKASAIRLMDLTEDELNYAKGLVDKYVLEKQGDIKSSRQIKSAKIEVDTDDLSEICIDDFFEPQGLDSVISILPVSDVTEDACLLIQDQLNRDGDFSNINVPEEILAQAQVIFDSADYDSVTVNLSSENYLIFKLDNPSVKAEEDSDVKLVAPEDTVVIETDDGDFLVKSKDSNFVEFIDEEMGDGTGDDEEMAEIVDGVNSSVKLVECDGEFIKNAGYKYCLVKSSKGPLLKNLMNNLDSSEPIKSSNQYVVKISSVSLDSTGSWDNARVRYYKGGRFDSKEPQYLSKERAEEIADDLKHDEQLKPGFGNEKHKVEVEEIESSRKLVKSSRVDLFGESCLIVDTDYIDNHDLYFVDYVIDNDVVEWSVFRDDEDTYYAVKGEY